MIPIILYSVLGILCALLIITIKGPWLTRCAAILLIAAFSIGMIYTSNLYKSLPLENMPDGKYNVSSYLIIEDSLYIWATTQEVPEPPFTYKIPYDQNVHKALQKGVNMTKGKQQFVMDIKNANKGEGKKGKGKGKGKGKKGKGKDGTDHRPESLPSAKVIELRNAYEGEK